jgi:MFS family permease
VLTALSAFATGFGTLFATRLGVGIGEATLAPCAYPILVEIVPERFTARAIGLYVAGATAVSGVAIASTGHLLDALAAIRESNGLAPWRIVFLVIASPGIVLALLSLTISSGRRPGRIAEQAPQSQVDGDRKAVLAPPPLFCGAAAYYAVLYILFSWTPSIFIREFGFSASEAGTLLGGEQVLSGVCGALLGAWLADRRGAGGRFQAALGLASIGLAAFMASLATIAIAPGAWVATAAALLGALFGGLGMSVLPMAVQEGTAPGARSRATAIFMLMINLFGTGLGPPLAGLLSDRLGPYHLSDAAALAGSALAMPGILMFWLLRRRRPEG